MTNPHSEPFSSLSPPATFASHPCQFLHCTNSTATAHNISAAMSTTPFVRRAPKQAPSTTAPGLRIRRGVPLPLGATVRRHGVNFSIFSGHATSCTLVLFHPGADDPYVEIPLDPREIAPDRCGTLLSKASIRTCNTATASTCSPIPRLKSTASIRRHVLLDPYARALSNGSAWGAHPPGQRPYRNNLIVENNFDWEHDQPLNIPLVDSVIYELHVRSFTAALRRQASRIPAPSPA